MKKRTTLFLFVTAVFIFFSTQAFAYDSRGKEMRKGKFSGKVMKALQLTDAQKDKIHALYEGSLKKVAGNWKEFEKLQSDLNQKVLASPGASKKECNKMINQITKLKAQILKNRLERWVKFVEILDSDQKEILSGRLKESKERRQKRRSNMKRYFPFPHEYSVMPD